MSALAKQLSALAPFVFTTGFTCRGMAVTAEKLVEKLKAELQTTDVVCYACTMDPSPVTYSSEFGAIVLTLLATASLTYTSDAECGRYFRWLWLCFQCSCEFTFVQGQEYALPKSQHHAPPFCRLQAFQQNLAALHALDMLFMLLSDR